MTDAPGADAAFRPHLMRSIGGATAAICPHGAHLLAWRPLGRTDNQFFLSRTSRYASEAAIRGGIPLVFPQFSGMGSLPKHGFARTRTWSALPTSDAARVSFELEESGATLALWPHRFRARLDVELGDSCLSVRLAVLNTGDTACEFTAALHGYFAVDDIANARVHGLQGRNFLDAANGMRPGREERAALPIEGEVDRVFHAVDGELALSDGGRRLVIEREGFPDVVVWNPGAEKAASLADLEPGGWRRMLCVEPACIERPVRLAPGERWTGVQRLRCVPLSERDR